VLADTNEDLKEEVLILGGSTGPTLSPPTDSQVYVLADLDVTYAGLSKELPYILTGAGVAVLFLVMLGLYAWRRSARKEEGWAAGFARFSPYFSARGGDESEMLRVGDADALLEDTKRFNYGGLETISGPGGIGGDLSSSSSSSTSSALGPVTPSLSGSRGGLPGTGASRKSSMRSRTVSRNERAERNLEELLGEDEEGGGAVPEDTVRF